MERKLTRSTLSDDFIAEPLEHETDPEYIPPSSDPTANDPTPSDPTT